MAKKPDTPPAAPVDHAQEVLFREVDEDLHREQMEELWRRYGKLVIGVAVAIVAVVAGHQGWQNWQKKVLVEEAARFEAAVALETPDRTQEALAALEEVSRESKGGFAALAGLRLAAIKQEQGDKAGALAAYDALAADQNADPALRDVATLLAVMVSMDGGDAAALTTRLAPLTADNNPWRFTAWELSAALAQAGGDDARAKDLLKRITDDPAAPRGARGRAAQLLDGFAPDAAPAGGQ